MNRIIQAIVYWILCIRGSKKMYCLEGDSLYQYIMNHYRTTSFVPSKFITKQFQVQTYNYNQHPYYLIQQSNGLKEKAILYIHGGGFVKPAGRQQWKFIKKILNNTDAVLYAPDYPLAPEHSCNEVYELLSHLYNEIRKNYKEENIIFMGESAGASIALSFSLLLKERNLPQPGQIIACSPVLKIETPKNGSTMKWHKLERKDPMLSMYSFDTIGAWWRGERENEDFLVSPWYGNYEGLNNISVFMGTRDVLSMDCETWYEHVKTQTRGIYYFEEKDMFHCWMYMPTPKGNQTKMKIISLINAKHVD